MNLISFPLDLTELLKVFDVAELSPPHERDNQTAALAAHLTSYLLHHLSPL